MPARGKRVAAPVVQDPPTDATAWSTGTVDVELTESLRLHAHTVVKAEGLSELVITGKLVAEPQGFIHVVLTGQKEEGATALTPWRLALPQMEYHELVGALRTLMALVEDATRRGVNTEAWQTARGTAVSPIETPTALSPTGDIF